MKISKYSFATIAIIGSLIPSVEGASWITYPGDAAIALGNDFQARRIERGGYIPQYYPRSEVWGLVQFERQVDFKKPVTCRVAAEGRCNFHFPWRDWDSLKKGEKEVTFPAGKYNLQVRVHTYDGTAPALFIDGPGFETDSSWLVSRLSQNKIPVEIPFGCDSIEKSPSRFAEFRLATKDQKPIVCKKEGNEVFADFGRESFGFIKLYGVKGKGTVRVAYGESEKEVRAKNPKHIEVWENVDVATAPVIRLPESRAYRYILVTPQDNGVSVEGVGADEEYLNVPMTGSFKCSDELLNKIWEVSRYTTHLNTREFLLDGIKRDRWVWTQDVWQGSLTGYYLFGDMDVVKRTLWHLRGKDPLDAHLGTIQNYSAQWFMMLRDYYRYSGDKNFLEMTWSRAVTLMDFIRARTNKFDLPYVIKGDWQFYDWVPTGYRMDYGKPGEMNAIAVQNEILGEKAFGEIAQVLGKEDVAKKAFERADRMTAAMNGIFWNPERGGFMQSATEEGKSKTQFTRYPNIFAVIFGLATEKQIKVIEENVLLNDKTDIPSQSPGWNMWHAEALSMRGYHKEALDLIRRYWGGMLKLGATSFWEVWDERETTVEQTYHMYSRPFGRSFCHIWGSPCLVMGRCFLGVNPVTPGYEKVSIAPNLGDLDWIEGSVPTPRGVIKIKVDKNGGMVILPNGRKEKIENGKKYVFSL